MSIPNTAYAEATVTNPSSNLTDFTLAIDLSLLPSEWWALVNTTDGTRGRVCKGDGVTELPGDWIDFNSSNQTGVLRTKWSGTLSSSGIQTLRIYPPNTGNTSYSIFGNFPNVSDPLYAGGAGTSESLNGILFNLQIHNIDRGAAWIIEEQNQVKDNATFWGTWTFVSAGSSNTFVHINNSWKEISDRYVKVNGQWKQITGGLVKSNGSWRIIF
jgi:hypothetical protein